MLCRDIESFGDALRARAYAARIPLTVTFEVTYGCNLRCLHCLNPTHGARGELSTTEIHRIVDGLADLGTLFLNVTGGEPTARADLPQILRHARRAGLKVLLLTNATLIDEAAVARLAEGPPDQVNVSLYGATAEVFDAVTRRPGAFTRFLRGFRLLRSTGIPLKLTSVVLRENVEQIEDMRALSHELGAAFSYSTDVNPRQDGIRDPLSHRVHPATVVALSERYSGFERGTCAESAALRGPFYCTCGRSSAAVTPYGDMNFCTAVPIPRQDIRGGRVREGWEALVRVRDSYDHAASDCASCRLYPYCTRGAQDSLLEAGDLGRCVPYFYELAALRETRVR